MASWSFAGVRGLIIRVFAAVALIAALSPLLVRAEVTGESVEGPDTVESPAGESKEPSEPTTQSPKTDSESTTKDAPAGEKEPTTEKQPSTEKKPSTGKESKAFPSYEEVEKTVAEQLNSLDDYKPGDLLTAPNVAPVFRKLEAIGWKVADRKEIEKLFLPESDWLVKQFRTKDGRKFMREVGRNAGGFDRVDRLRKMPYGERQLADLIKKPDGYKMVEYMVTTPGGKNLGKSLSRGKNGGKFNEATGRLYVDKQLLDRLKQSHQAEMKRRGLAT